MKRLLLYYKRVLSQRRFYHLAGKLFGVSLWSRITHNLDLLLPTYASKMSRILYEKDGSSRSKSDLTDIELDILSSMTYSHKVRSRSCLEYWVAHKLKEVPPKYIREFLADRYADCGLDSRKMLSLNRDLFFLQEDGDLYEHQVQNILEAVSLSACDELARSQFKDPNVYN